MGEWLHGVGADVDKTPVGISASGSDIALATKSQGWLITPGAPPAAYSVLRKGLTGERTAPALVVRDTEAFMLPLSRLLGGESRSDNLNNLLPNIVHDMAALEYTTGRGIARGLSPLKDALDCAVVGPAMALEAPRFYREVGMPLIRHNAKVYGIDESAVGWKLTYDWLLFKVLAHYTHDPTLSRWFQDGNNPLDMFGKAVELNAKEASAFLLWMVCGEDEGLLSQHHPDWAAALPEAPQLIKATHIDKNLPSLRLGLIRLTDKYGTSRRAATMYGRHSPWGLRPSELLYFSIMGSVDDILDVAVASIANMGSEAHWLVPEKSARYSRWLRAQVAGYTQEEPMQWEENLTQLASLGSPLGAIPLEPKVSVE